LDFPYRLLNLSIFFCTLLNLASLLETVGALLEEDEVVVVDTGPGVVSARQKLIT